MRYWMRQLNNPNAQLRMQAYAAFNQTKSESVPFLVEALNPRETISDRAVEWASIHLRHKLPAFVRSLLPLPNPASFEIKHLAINSLVQMGPGAIAANPALLRGLNNPNPTIASDALMLLQATSISDPAVAPALEKNLGRVNPGIRLGAAHLLWRLRGKKEVIIPVLIEALRGTDPNGEWSAAGLLPQMMPEAQAAIPALVQALAQTNRDNRVRGKAAITLGEMGPLAHVAVPALTKATNDVYSNVREAAVEALKRITLEQAPTSRE